jgi:NADH-quinone oxidoreductase subunit C
MSDSLDSVIAHIAEKFSATISEFAGEKTLLIAPEKVLDLAKYLKTAIGFEFLSALTAVDYWPAESPRFHLFYRFTSISRQFTLNVRIPISGIKPVVSSIEPFYYNAGWHEREVFDMFGIKFDGNKDLRRILMPHDWEGYPLRKDYPLGYEEPQFTFNYDEIAVRKPFAKSRPEE